MPDHIATTRLLLRPLTWGDFDAHYAMVGRDPLVTWQRRIHSPEEARAALKSRIRHWEEHRFGMWAAIEHANGRLLGHGGLQYLEESGDVELGYYLGRVAWGRGLATELGRAAIEYGLNRLRLPEIVAVVRPENHASQRVLSKLGFSHRRQAHHYGFDVQLWCLAATEYQPNPDAYSLLSV